VVQREIVDERPKEIKRCNRIIQKKRSRRRKKRTIRRIWGIHGKCNKAEKETGGTVGRIVRKLIAQGIAW
jgi:ribosomal protein L20